MSILVYYARMYIMFTTKECEGCQKCLLLERKNKCQFLLF